MKLKLSDIKFDEGSVVDPAGTVFHYEDRVFRAIVAEYVPIYRNFLQSEFINDVFDAGLIETWIPDFELEGYELVLEHKKVPFLSSWTEWCSPMIQDATAMVCRLNLELCKHGYITKDIQPGNVQFINGKPVWIDFGSIVPLIEGRKFRFDEFRYHSVLPLWLLSKKRHKLSQSIFQEVGKGYLKALSTRWPFGWLPPEYELIKRKAQKDNTLLALEMLLEYVEELSITPHKSSWTNYGQGGMPPVNLPSQFDEKASAVYKLLRRLPPGSLLDVAGNKGWYAELAASMGHQVVCFDIDDASISNLYQRVKEKETTILPVVQDFLFTTPAYGIGLGKANAFDRYRADTTLVLALIHHLVFKKGVFFEPIVKIISMYTKKNAIIEFVPPEDCYVKEWFNPSFSWYSLENFVKTLERYFSSIEIHDSWPKPRKLILCSKSG